jgi:glycosyltransferase involved in cell wall biosynthesis
MRVLFPAGYYDPEQYSSRQAHLDLVGACVSAGFDVSVITPAPSRGVPPDVRREYNHRKNEHTHGGHVEIVRFPMFREKRHPLLRALRFLLCQLAQYRSAAARQGADLVLADSTPPTQGLLSVLIAKKLHIPLVYWLLDIFPDSLVSAGLTKKGSLLYRIGRKVEAYTYLRADAILVLNEACRQKLMSKGVPPEKLTVIPTWVDTDTVRPVPRLQNRLFDELALPRDGFYITYAGNFGATQGLDTVLRAASLLHDEPGIRFLLFGAGVMEEKLRQLADLLQLTNVRFVPLQPADRVAEVYSLGNASLVICKKGAGQSAVPSKTWSILAAGCPVLASFDEDSALCRSLTANACGVCVPPEDPAALADRIRRLYADAASLKSMGDNGRRYVCREHGREASLDAFICLFKHLTEQDGGKNAV